MHDKMKILEDKRIMPFLVISFIRFTVELMLSVAALLKESVASAPSLPAMYKGVWDPFFEAVERLRNDIAHRKVDEIPELADALEGVKDAIRELGGLVTTRLNSRNEDIWNAAVLLQQEFFPDGLEVVTDKQHNVVGWTLKTIDRLKTSFMAELELIRGVYELESLESAVVKYTKVAGRYYAPPSADDAPKTTKELLDACRIALRGVILELSHLLFRHPEYAPIVTGMLRPLTELTEKVRAENQRKAKAEKDGEAPKQGDTQANNDEASEDDSENEAPDADEAEVDEVDEPVEDEADGEAEDEAEDEVLEAEAEAEEATEAEPDSSEAPAVNDDPESDLQDAAEG